MKLIGQPRPGVCDECGHAVVRSIKHPPRDGWQNGHFYQKFKLRKVLCAAHGGVFPVESPAHDCIISPPASMIVQRLPRHARKEFPGFASSDFGRRTTIFGCQTPLTTWMHAGTPPSGPKSWPTCAARPSSSAGGALPPAGSATFDPSAAPISRTAPSSGLRALATVEAHAVRPPPAFVAHVLRLPPSEWLPGIHTPSSP